MEQRKNSLGKGNPLTLSLSSELIEEFTIEDKEKYLYPRFDKLQESLGLSLDNFVAVVKEWKEWKRAKALKELSSLKSLVAGMTETERKQYAKELGFIE